MLSQENPPRREQTDLELAVSPLLDKNVLFHHWLYIPCKLCRHLSDVADMPWYVECWECAADFYLNWFACTELHAESLRVIRN